MSTDFASTVKKGCFSLDLRSATKQGIIEELVDLLVQAGKVTDREAAIRAVTEREDKMSTGLQFGVAFPHGKMDGIDDLATVFALKKEGIDFGAMDGQPSKIFVMTLSPITCAGPHIEYLSQMGRKLHSLRIRERILEAATAEEITAILLE